MEINSWQDLQTLFGDEIKGEWISEFPRKEFIIQKIRKVFSDYDRDPNKPTSKERWKRLIETYMRNAWKQSGYRKTLPFMPKQVPEGPTHQKIDYTNHGHKCEFCFDLYSVWVKAIDGSHETLMLCDCADIKDRSNWKIPQWDPGLEGIYEKHQCPLDWFKPMVLAGQMEQIDEKARNWRARVRRAEAFWAERGFTLNS